MTTIREVLGCGHAFLCCDPDDEATDVLSIMREHGLKYLPVVREHAKFVGIVTLDELVAYCGGHETAAHAGPDGQINEPSLSPVARGTLRIVHGNHHHPDSRSPR